MMRIGESIGECDSCTHESMKKNNSFHSLINLLPDWLLTNSTGKLRNNIHAATCVITIGTLAGIIYKRIGLKVLKINCSDHSVLCMDE
jgi:hypothetical protein